MSMTPLLSEHDHTDNLFARGRFIYDALCTSGAALIYRVGEELAAHGCAKVLMQSSDWDFNVEEFAAAGHCALHPLAEQYADIDAEWQPDPGAIFRSYNQAWYRIAWQGAEVEVLRLTVPSACGDQIV